MRPRNWLHSAAPEVWGGFECTLNRVGDVYRDQLEETGYYFCPDNVELLSSLGIKACRYPMLWERYDGISSGSNRWEFARQELADLKECGIVPIIGLLHHGSGPAHTRLDDPAFPTKFRQHAEAVASRFPWVTHYTPINEPLTTARFSGLYGFWYPHLTDSLAFIRMLLNQLKATVLAMRSIREINPQAKLIQTEDLSKVHSTPALQYQADFENIRRWLTFDLLCGKVDQHHRMWQYLQHVGIRRAELDFFLENTCVPDIIGLNYYVTSERYLDEQCDNYPHITPGSNGCHTYVDTEAFQVRAADGIQKLLTEAWLRFGIPVAITEVHLGCTREEQMRWLHEVWSAACRANDEGVQIVAVTPWSIFGSVDWNSLVTQRDGNYEPGAFDVRNGVRRTALAHMIEALGDTGTYHHPLLVNKGWWQRHSMESSVTRQPLLVIGQNGYATKSFFAICQQRGIGIVALLPEDIDLSQLDDIMQEVTLINPWGIISTSGLPSIDETEQQLPEAHALAVAHSNIAAVCSVKSLPFLPLSSRHVSEEVWHSPAVVLQLMNDWLDLFIDRALDIGESLSDGENFARGHSSLAEKQ